MKNFKGGKSTMIVQIPEGVEFEKAKDYVGKYEKGDMVIMGYLKTKSEKYKTDNYSLYVIYKNQHKLLNVPGWYGRALEEDFIAEGSDAEKYFDNAYIKEIAPMSTKNGNDTINIDIYEDEQ